MKFIRECRMGPTKSFKTGAVVGTYPKPMLCFMFDQGGLDIVQSKKVPVPPGDVAMDVTAEDIVFISPRELGQYITKPTEQQPKVLAINYFAERKNIIDLDLRAVPDIQPMVDFVGNVDQVFKTKPLPWATVVLDSVTGYQDLILGLIASKNPTALSDARQWAFQVGQKVKQTVAAMTCFPSHIVVIMHTEFEKNELTGVINELPSVYSGFRNEVGCYFSQFFYAGKVNGKPVIFVNDTGYVKGLGPRWPSGLPAVCGPDFKSIYGREYGI